MQKFILYVLFYLPYSCIAQTDYPDPRIVIVGSTGAGKSSLADALLGCDPRIGGCTFSVCGGLTSCTNETKIGTGPWLGGQPSFTIVDTPGFGDSSGRDNQLISEMMEVLKDTLGYCNAIVLAIDGNTPRFTSGLTDMLKQMSSIFGEKWWNYMIIGVTKWPYDQNSIDKRNADCDFYGDPSENCFNEAWFKRELSAKLSEKFDLHKDFKFAFMDSWSQAGPNINDMIQQVHWQEETSKLWAAATDVNETFVFKTIDDVLEENFFCKEENKRLNRIIEEDIERLNSQVDELNIRVNQLPEVPIGTIIAWTLKIDLDGGNIISLPEGWVRCDGNLIPSNSTWAGRPTPDLNGGKRFLRGGKDAEVLIMEDHMLQDHQHSVSVHDPGHQHGGIYTHSSHGGTGAKYHDLKGYKDTYDKYHMDQATTGIYITVNHATGGQIGSETRPKNMNVIYIMRVF